MTAEPAENIEVFHEGEIERHSAFCATAPPWKKLRRPEFWSLLACWERGTTWSTPELADELLHRAYDTRQIFRSLPGPRTTRGVFLDADVGLRDR